MKKKVFYGWFIVLGSILITCTMVPLIMSLSSKYLLLVTTEMGVSRSSFTLSNTILQALGIFLSPIVTKHLIKGNMQKIQSLSIIGFAIAYASYSLAQNVYHLYLSSLFVGFFYLNSTLIPISMMITSWFIKKRGVAMSMAMAGIGLGGFLFSPIVTYLLETYGWRQTYRIMALIVFLVAFPVAFFLLKKKPADIGLKPYGIDNKPVVNRKDKNNLSIILTVKESRKKLFLYLLLLGMLTNGIINSGALGQFPPALEELQGAGVQAAIISMYSLIGIFGKLLLGWFNDRFGIIVSTSLGCLGFGLSFLFMLFGKNVLMLYIMALCFGFGNAIGTVTPPLIVASIFGSKKYGEVYGITNSIMQIGLSVGSLIVASLYDMTGSYQPAWLLLLVLTVFTFMGWIAAYYQSRRYC